MKMVIFSIITAVWPSYCVKSKGGVGMLGEPYMIKTFFVITGSPRNITRMSPMFKVIKEENSNIDEAAEMSG